jgi:protein-L-isoaspartate(D-aspartate) O-methyltransferase
MDDNQKMINSLLDSKMIDENVAEAMLKVKRELFVPEEQKQHAYSDVPLPIGHGQTISAPSIVGFMSMKLDAGEGMKILEIGTGSGYQAAILGELIGKKGKVYTIERKPELIELAKKNIKKSGVDNVVIIEGDGTQGYAKEAPFDRIIVTAGSPDVPKPLIEQLKKGGKMLIPVGPAHSQYLILVEKNGEIKKTAILPVVFVPLVGKYGHPESK